MLFRTQIIFCSSELRLHFRIAEVGSLLSLNRAWRAQVTYNIIFYIWCSWGLRGVCGAGGGRLGVCGSAVVPPLWRLGGFGAVMFGNIAELGGQGFQ